MVCFVLWDGKHSGWSFGGLAPFDGAFVNNWVGLNSIRSSNSGVSALIQSLKDWKPVE